MLRDASQGDRVHIPRKQQTSRIARTMAKTRRKPWIRLEWFGIQTVYAQTLYRESSRFDVRIASASRAVERTVQKSHGTVEEFRVVSSPRAKKTKIRHENGAATVMESQRAIANFLVTPSPR